jgi:hypothetical protein
LPPARVPPSLLKSRLAPVPVSSFSLLGVMLILPIEIDRRIGGLQHSCLLAGNITRQTHTFRSTLAQSALVSERWRKERLKRTDGFCVSQLRYEVWSTRARSVLCAHLKHFSSPPVALHRVRMHCPHRVGPQRSQMWALTGH